MWHNIIIGLAYVLTLNSQKMMAPSPPHAQPICLDVSLQCFFQFIFLQLNIVSYRNNVATFIFCYNHTNEQFFMTHFLEIYISNEADWIVFIFRAKKVHKLLLQNSIQILIVTKRRKQKFWQDKNRVIELRGTRDLNSSFHGLKLSNKDIYIPTLIINIRSLKKEVAPNSIFQQNKFIILYFLSMYFHIMHHN